MAQETKTINKFANIDVSKSTVSGLEGARTSSGDNNNAFVREDLKVFKYDASAPSGSRFTEVTNLVTDFTLLADAGDRLYIGAPSGIKTWAFCCLTTAIKSSETMIAKYYSQSANDLVSVEYVSLLTENLNQNNKKIFENLNEKECITLDKSINLDWSPRDNIVDKIPNTGVTRFWLVLENPIGGLTTPPTIQNVFYRSGGISQTALSQQQIFWGTSRLYISKKIACVNFWNGLTPETAVIAITSTHSARVHNMRNAADDEIHYSWSLPYGIDTSSPMEFCLSYSASQAINTADIAINLKTVSHTNGVIGAGETSDRIVTKNLNITASGKVETTTFMTDYYVSDFKEEDIIFIELQRTDANGGSFYPLELCINYPIYKIGKFEA